MRKPAVRPTRLALDHAAAAVVVREKSFRTRRYPLHGPPGGFRRHHGRAVLRIAHAAATETATHVLRDNLDPVLRDLGVTRQLHAQHVRALHARMNGVALGALVESDQARSRLHGARHHAPAREPETRHVCSRCELRFCRGRVARFALERQVAGDVFVEQGRRCGQRVVGVAYARQVFVRDLDQPTSVLRDVDRLGTTRDR